MALKLGLLRKGFLVKVASALHVISDIENEAETALFLRALYQIWKGSWGDQETEIRDILRDVGYYASLYFALFQNQYARYVANGFLIVLKVANDNCDPESQQEIIADIEKLAQVLNLYFEPVVLPEPTGDRIQQKERELLQPRRALSVPEIGGFKKYHEKIQVEKTTLYDLITEVFTLYANYDYPQNIKDSSSELIMLFRAISEVWLEQRAARDTKDEAAILDELKRCLGYLEPFKGAASILVINLLQNLLMVIGYHQNLGLVNLAKDQAPPDEEQKKPDFTGIQNFLRRLILQLKNKVGQSTDFCVTISDENNRRVVPRFESAIELYKEELRGSEKEAEVIRGRRDLKISNIADSKCWRQTLDLLNSIPSISARYRSQMNRLAYYGFIANNHLTDIVRKFFAGNSVNLADVLAPIYNLFRLNAERRIEADKCAYILLYQDLKGIDIRSDLFITGDFIVKYWQEKFYEGALRVYVDLLCLFANEDNEIKEFISFCRYLQQDHPQCIKNCLSDIKRTLPKYDGRISLLHLLYYDLTDGYYSLPAIVLDKDLDFYKNNADVVAEYCDLLALKPADLHSPRPAALTKQLDFYLLLFRPNIIFPQQLFITDKIWEYLRIYVGSIKGCLELKEGEDESPAKYEKTLVACQKIKQKLDLSYNFNDLRSVDYLLLFEIAGSSWKLYKEYLFNQACLLFEGQTIAVAMDVIWQSRKIAMLKIVENYEKETHGFRQYNDSDLKEFQEKAKQRTQKIIEYWRNLLDNQKDPESYLQVIKFYYEHGLSFQSRLADFIVVNLCQWLIAETSPLAPVVDYDLKIAACFYAGRARMHAENQLIEEEINSHGIRYIRDGLTAESEARLLLHPAALLSQDGKNTAKAFKSIIHSLFEESKQLVHLCYFLASYKNLDQMVDLLTKAGGSVGKLVAYRSGELEGDSNFADDIMEMAEMVSLKTVWQTLAMKTLLDSAKSITKEALFGVILDRIYQNLQAVNVLCGFLAIECSVLNDFGKVFSRWSSKLNAIDTYLRQYKDGKKLYNLFILALNPAMKLDALPNPPKSEKMREWYNTKSAEIKLQISEDVLLLLYSCLRRANRDLKTLRTYLAEMKRLTERFRDRVVMDVDRDNINDGNIQEMEFSQLGFRDADWLEVKLEEISVTNSAYFDLLSKLMSLDVTTKELAVIKLSVAMLIMRIILSQEKNTEWPMEDVYKALQYALKSSFPFNSSSLVFVNFASWLQVLPEKYFQDDIEGDARDRIVEFLQSLIVGNDDISLRQSANLQLHMINKLRAPAVVDVTAGRPLESSSRKMVEQPNYALVPLHLFAKNELSTQLQDKLGPKFIQLYMDRFLNLVKILIFGKANIVNIAYTLNYLCIFYSLLAQHIEIVPEELVNLGIDLDRLELLLRLSKEVQSGQMSLTADTAFLDFIDVQLPFFASNPQLVRHLLQQTSGFYYSVAASKIVGVVPSPMLGKFICGLELGLTQDHFRELISYCYKELTKERLRQFLIVGTRCAQKFDSELTDEILAAINAENRLFALIRVYCPVEVPGDWHEFNANVMQLLEYDKFLEDGQPRQFRFLLQTRGRLRLVIERFINKYHFIDELQAELKVQTVQEMLTAIVVAEILDVMNKKDRSQRDLDDLQAKYGKCLDHYNQGKYDCIYAAQASRAQVFCETVGNYRRLQQMRIRLGNFYHTFTYPRQLLIFSPSKVEAGDKAYKSLALKRSATPRIVVSLQGNNSLSCRLGVMEFSLFADSFGNRLSIFDETRQSFYYCPDQQCFVAPFTKSLTGSLTGRQKKLIRALVFQGAVLGYRLKIEIRPRDEGSIEFAKRVNEYFSQVYTKMIEVLNSPHFLADPYSYLTRLSKSDAKLLDFLFENCKDILTMSAEESLGFHLDT